MPKILIIEDEPQIRDIIQEILECEGYRTLEADNGLTGLQLAQQSPPDLIVCDVMMPELDGFDVLKGLRANPGIGSIPMIFLTAKTDRASVRKGMNLGADDYITKPFTHLELLSAIDARLKKQALVTQQYTQTIQGLEAGLNALTYYDHLTQLPNRRLLEEQFQHIQAEKQIADTLDALVLVGIDRFEWIKSTLGAAFSDQLVQAITQQLSAHRYMGNYAMAMVARIEADQFAIIPRNIKSRPDLDQFAKQILNILATPFYVVDQELCITPSIGMTCYPKGSTDIGTLISNAEIAMYQSKQQVGPSAEFYLPTMRSHCSQTLTMAARLRHALDKNELRLYYQPHIDLQTSQVVGAEALLRWHHPEWGVLSPNVFIPIAEETDLILDIGEWVLRTSCLQVKRWQQTCGRPLQMLVNLSPRQLIQPALPSMLHELLSSAALDPGSLVLELTESTLMQDPDLALKVMHQIKATGIRLSIDDFGTGYSSLSYLQRFPLDILKIDRGFIHEINRQPTNAAITTAIIQMGHKLGLSLIGEGVETLAERKFLLDHQCDGIQGYLISPPLPAAELLKYFPE
ncbi:EAL domain-containing response regulator [Acaryochloris sp. CCMEE 5410]|uniref:EAL domain-containing response regulator n=1 Tax=Acaryochloris sp. CCMEE 5410 TaxID=310037 RepID=UPI00024842DC|nr:EAL domain-containing response regulator [Acaryochloris sp. CCMEE 5410]KAI9134072.1 EAL domain-containing protein [Acaryochloris sp. CCMEE 5410]